MSGLAIKVENLSKRYRIGLKEEMHDTFAGAVTDTLTRPIRNLRRPNTTTDWGMEPIPARRRLILEHPIRNMNLQPFNLPTCNLPTCNPKCRSLDPRCYS